MPRSTYAEMYLKNVPVPKHSVKISMFGDEMTLIDEMIQSLPRAPLISILPLFTPLTWRLWQVTVVPLLFPNEQGTAVLGTCSVAHRIWWYWMKTNL
jgi:hypothetical protein